MANPRLTPPPARSSESGFSMVEMLIAAFIMSIGLLGLLALQVTSISNATSSRERGTATLLAHDLLDRIQSEGALAAAERYDSGTVTSTGWTFIDPVTITNAVSSAGATNLYYDIKGNPTTMGAANVQYTVSWQRQAGITVGSRNAMQPFVVNVQWVELVKVNGVNTLLQKYFSVSRNVRV